MLLFFLLTLVLFVRFEIYKRINAWSEKQIKRDCNKQKKKIRKGKKDEQTIYMSNGKTVDLTVCHGLRSKCDTD